MTLDEFLPLVGQTLLVDCAPEAVRLTLVSATPLAPSSLAPRPPFALIFRSDPDALLVDGSYTMTSGAFGPAVIFISSVIAPPGAAPGYHYQAIFN